MRGDIVQRLMCDVVALKQRVEVEGGDNFHFVSKGMNLTQQYRTAFLMNYADLGIGWKAAKLFAQAHEKLPVYLTADDHWIWRAYLVHCNPNLYFDRHVTEAEALTDSSMTHVRHTIQALLLSKDATFEDIAKTTGIALDTIVAYEKLFYNIRDRLADYSWLGKQVYPQGRTVELYDNYLRNVSFGDILRRTGYNSGKEYVSFMAGLRSTLIKDMAAGDMAVRLERTIMANGYILAESGLLNQRSDAQGLRTAQSMINAAKAGGMENQEQSGFDDVRVAVALRGEMAALGVAEFKLNQAELERMSAETIDVAAEAVSD